VSPEVTMAPSIEGLYAPRAQAAQQVVAFVILAIFATVLTLNVGAPVAAIVSGAMLVGLFCWRATNLCRPIEPQKTALLFLATAAALHVHMIEEHTRLFGPAMSRLFGIAFPDSRFLLIFVFVLPVVYYVCAIGLLLGVPMAAFIAWFIFIGPGVAELSHFVFPLLRPSLEPSNLAPISATIHGIRIDHMENHWMHATGRYYFPGLYTAVLPMIPGISAIVFLFRRRRVGSTA
jgi:hypothetical protein